MYTETLSCIFGTKQTVTKQTVCRLKQWHEERCSLFLRERPRITELGVSLFATHQFLHFSLHISLQDCDYTFACCDREQRLHFASWARCEEHILCNTLFSDEAYLHF